MFRISERSHAAQQRVSSPPGDQIRRLDWRFLLPTPELKRVFFLGPPRSSLLSALWEYGCEVATAPPARLTGWFDQIVGRFDVCVLQSTSERDVELAARLVAPGGWLYWEVSRRSPLVAPWRLFATARSKDRVRFASLLGCRRLLERSKLSAIASSWHYPDFDACRRIIPLEGRAGVRYFSPTGPALLRPVAEWLGASVIASALFPGIGSSVSFVAQKSFSFLEEAS